MSLPPCVDGRGHHFTVHELYPDKAVCTRCGLIRSQK